MCRSEELDRRRGLTSELDEMWSYVAKKSQPRWLWHAIEHHTGKVLAYVCLDASRMRSSCNSNSCWSPLASRSFTRIAGGLRAASRSRAASGGEGAHAKNREQACQSADPDQVT